MCWGLSESATKPLSLWLSHGIPWAPQQPTAG